MTRLTNALRETMARRLVAHRYADAARELQALTDALAARAYAHCYPTKLRDAMKIVQEHFPSEFMESGWIRVNAYGLCPSLGESIHNAYLSATNWRDLEGKERQIWLLTSSWTAHDISADRALMDDVQTFAYRKKDFDQDCGIAFHEALAVLNKITTAKRLEEAWPEAMPVIADLLPEERRTLPAVQVADINAKFGLPPEAAEAA